MERVLLFSENKEMFEITKKIAGDEYILRWCTYKYIEENKYPQVDIVIMHFEEQITKGGAYEAIIRVRGRLGHLIPILVVIEGGTPQDYFLTLKLGAFDYLETVDNLQEYKKKIEATILWKWYLKKYGSVVQQ